MKHLLYITLLTVCTHLGTQAQELDRSIRPKPAPAPAIQLDSPQSFQLENGLKVFVVENHKLPRVSYALVLDVDPPVEGAAKGYVELTGELLGTGTKNRTKDQIDEAVDFIGANLSTSATGISATCLKKHQEKLLDLMSDIVLYSEFSEAELAKLKTQYESGLASAKDNPDQIAANVREVLNYGTEHPYGELMTETSLANITLDKCNQYYRSHFRPGAAYMAIVGDISLREVKPLIEKYFAKWEVGATDAVKYPLVKEPEASRVAVVHKEGAVQSVINITYPVNLMPGDKDAIAADVMNTILGGGFTSRLFMNLREDKSYTYGARSQLKKDPIAGFFNAMAKVRTEVTDSALVEFFREMHRLRTEKVGKEELEGIKNFLAGVFALRLEDPRTIARFAINTERYGLPQDYYTNYLKNLEAVSVEDISHAAQKYIRPDNAHIIVVGNRDEIAPKLSMFDAEGSARFYDVYGNELKQSDAVMPEGLSAETVIDNYIEAIGGKAAIEQIKDISINLSVAAGPMQLSVNLQKKVPNMYLYTMGNGLMTMQKQVYDGKKAVLSDMSGKTEELSGDKLLEAKVDAQIIPEMHYKEFGYTMELKTIEQVGGKDAYKIVLTAPEGSSFSEFFDVESGLKVKRISAEETPMGVINVTAHYDDYRAVSDVLFPYAMSQTLGPQSLKMKVNSIEVNTGLGDEVFK